MIATRRLSLAACVALPAFAFAQEIAAPQPRTGPATEPAPSFELTPYGTLALALQRNDAVFGAGAQDYAKYVTNEAGETFLAGARQSRVGARLRFPGENVLGAALTGRVELDFVTTGGTTWDGALPRLRFAYLEAARSLGPGRLALLVGQAEGILNRLHPEAVAYYGCPAFAGAGNLFRRSPQLRITYDLEPSERLGLALEVGALNPSDGSNVNRSAGNRSGLPDVEARVAARVKAAEGISATLGVGYHHNVKRFDDTAGGTEDVTATLVGLDAVVDLTRFVQLRGEAYLGSGTDDIYGGIAGTVGTSGPSVPAAVVGPAGSREPVDGRGFWVQAVAKPIPRCWLAIGGGLASADYGNDANIPKEGLSSNRQLYAGLIGHLSKGWRLGLELLRVTTTTYPTAGSATTTTLAGTQVSVASQLRF